MRQIDDLDIGPRVKGIRKQRGLSLDGLARASGVSKAMLSQIEQNKANPTVGVMYKIAVGLGMDLGELMGLGRSRRQLQVIRSDDPNQVFLSDKKMTVRTLSPLSMEKDVEFYEVTLRPGGELDSSPHFSQTEEFLTVAQGKISLGVEDDEIALRKGDSAHYLADQHHGMRNTGRSVARIYLVVKYRREG